jgi:hypothetical protein
MLAAILALGFMRPRQLYINPHQFMLLRALFMSLHQHIIISQIADIIIAILGKWRVSTHGKSEDGNAMRNMKSMRNGVNIGMIVGKFILS